MLLKNPVYISVSEIAIAISMKFDTMVKQTNFSILTIKDSVLKMAADVLKIFIFCGFFCLISIHFGFQLSFDALIGI